MVSFFVNPLMQDRVDAVIRVGVNRSMVVARFFIFLIDDRVDE